MIRVEIVINMAHILINMNILSIILFQQWERQSSYSAWLANHASSQPQDFLLLCDRDATWRQVLTSSLCTRSQLHSCHCNHDMRCPGPCSQSSPPHSYLSTQNHHQVSQEHQAYHPIFFFRPIVHCSGCPKSIAQRSRLYNSYLPHNSTFGHSTSGGASGLGTCPTCQCPMAGTWDSGGYSEDSSVYITDTDNM